MKKKKIYHAAVYVRLSKEDGDIADAKKAESNSISNQKSLIMHFLKNKDDIKAVSTFEDDGYTGSNFDRPGFRKMMDRIESGDIDCVIVKDLSRFGREYISAGNYIQRVFPALGVRFIAINDNVDTIDTLNPVNEVVIPFKNLVNDAFCADTSIKIRSQLDAKRRQGEFVGAFCPYGYKKDPSDHNHLVPDEAAAFIVRRIFSMIQDGLGLEAISDCLNADGVKSPMEYKNSLGMNYTCNFASGGRTKWTPVAVRRIATNPVYVGTLVQGVVSTPNHKVKKRIVRDIDDRISVKNTHEPVINIKAFETVQRLLGTDMRTAPGRKGIYLLSGLCRCADCGATMTRKNAYSKGRKYVYYVCSNNRRSGACAPHRIRGEQLEAIVISTIKSVLRETVEKGDVASVMDGMASGTDESMLARALEAAESEIADCEKTLALLYEDYKDGTVGDKDFAVIRRNLTQKRTEAEGRRRSLSQNAKDGEERKKKRKLAAMQFLKYSSVDELDRTAVVSLIREARVHEDGRIEVVFDCDDGFVRIVGSDKKEPSEAFAYDPADISSALASGCSAGCVTEGQVM